MPELFSANLDRISLISLLQLAESEKLTGSFRVEPEGSILVHSGWVVGGVHGRLTGLDAVLTLLMVRSSRTSFEQHEVEALSPLIETMPLVLDGARLNDDWGNLSSRVLKPRASCPIAAQPDRVQQVLAALDGHRIVEEALTTSNIDIILVIDDLLDLWEGGQLEEVAEPQPKRVLQKTATRTPAPQRRTQHRAPDQPADFYELLDASRAALRSKNYAETQRLLLAAAALRPDDRNVKQNLRRLDQIIKSNL